jgi:hypothetical protein
VAHQDNGGALVERVLDGGEGGDDALGVRDGAGGFVLGNIEIDANENAFSGEGDVFDGFFHSGSWVGYFKKMTTEFTELTEVLMSSVISVSSVVNR